MAPHRRAEGQGGQGRESCANPREGKRHYSTLMPSVLESDQSTFLSSQEKVSQLCTGLGPVLWASGQKKKKALCIQISTGEARTLKHPAELFNGGCGGCSCSSGNARKDKVLQAGDPLMSDEKGPACIFQNSCFYLSQALSPKSL